jgi:hypothetical protein
MMTPFKNIIGYLQPANKIFYKKLSSTRMTMELAFGELKNRFERCIDINTTIKKGVNIVVTCCVLQNI